MIDAMPPPVVAALAAAIGSVPGCSVNARHPFETGPRTSGPADHHIALDGWSPSLHALTMRWKVTLAPHRPVDEQTADALSQIHARLETQRARAAAGLALPGLSATAFPLPTASSLGIPSVSHLHCDASALALVIGDPAGNSVRSPPHTPEQASRHRAAELAASCWTRIRDISGHVQTLHHAVDRDPGGATVRHEDIAVAERSGLRVAEWAQGVRTPGHPGPSMQAILHGSTLRLDPVDIPDTLAGALAGRPLRDLVDIHPSLSSRTIRRVRTLADGRVSVTLEPAPVAIADYSDMVVGDALARLARHTGEDAGETSPDAVAGLRPVARAAA